MTVGRASCLVCGKPLQYFEEAQEVVCHECGKKETGHSICQDGHYVCDACHRTGGVDLVMKRCKESYSRNPIELAMEIMNHRSIYPNGPEHHTLVGAVLLAAYHNAGGGIDLDKTLEELRWRSLHLPGGTCGFWGTCGAAVSAGMYMSIITGSTPMTREPWARTTRLTARILDKLADLGGPRCCKRTSFTSIKEAVEYTKEVQGVEMELSEKIICTHSARNAECLRKACPYFPGRTCESDGE